MPSAVATCLLRTETEDPPVCARCDRVPGWTEQEGPAGRVIGPSGAGGGAWRGLCLAALGPGQKALLWPCPVLSRWHKAGCMGSPVGRVSEVSRWALGL